MLTFPEKGFGLSVWSLSPSVFCLRAAVSNPLHHFSSLSHHRLEPIPDIFSPRITNSCRSSARRQAEVMNRRSDGKFSSPQPTNMSDNSSLLYVTLLHSGALLLLKHTHITSMNNLIYSAHFYRCFHYRIIGLSVKISENKEKNTINSS